MAAPGAVRVISTLDSGLRTSLDAPADTASSSDMKSCMLLVLKAGAATLVLETRLRETPNEAGAKAEVLALMRAAAKAIFVIRNMMLENKYVKSRIMKFAVVYQCNVVELDRTQFEVFLKQLLKLYLLISYIEHAN